MRTLSMVEARKRLTTLPEELEGRIEDNTVAVTRRGKPVLAIMSWDFFESLCETLDVIADEQLMKSLRQGIEAIKEGKTIPWESAKKELGD